MYAGQCVETADVHALFAQPAHPYTRALLASVPRLDMPAASLKAIAGQPPDLFAPPAGCAFAARCQHAMHVCRQIAPPSTALPAQGSVRCWLHDARRHRPARRNPKSDTVVSTTPFAPTTLSFSGMFAYIGFRQGIICLEIAMKNLLSAALLAAALGVALPTVSHAEKVLRLNNVEEPSSLNPALGLNLISWEPLNNLMEGLVRLDAKHNAAPATAEKWDVSADGKTYTFHLRRNAKWSDGSPVTAGDFVYGWTQLLTPATASPAAFLLYDIVGAQDFNAGKAQSDALGVRALDPHTLQVTLNAPSLSFLNILTNPGFAPVNQKVAQANPKWHTEADSYVSNGPFMLKEWEHASSMRFEKNPNYWDKDAVKLDAVDWVMINDLNTSYQMFRTGELDATPSPLPAALYEKVKDSKEFVTVPQAGVYFYRFNTKMPPFQNADIRRAFALAVNRQDIVDYVVKQGRKAADAFVSPGFTGPDGKDFYQTSNGFVKTDVAQAKTLLKKAFKPKNIRHCRR